MASSPIKHTESNKPQSDGLVTLSAQPAAGAASFQKRLEAIIRLHASGVAGNAEAVLEADRQLEKLRADYPHKPLADAYHGSIMILIARDRSKPLEKLRWSKRGLKLLDGAVAAAPEDTMVRLLRGKAAYQLPEKHFQRTQTAIEDYGFLIDQHKRQKSGLSQEQYAQLQFELGESYHRLGRNQDAAKSWKGLERDPKLGRQAKMKLEGVKGKPATQPVAPSDSLGSRLIAVAARATGSSILEWVESERKKAKRRRKKKRRH